MKTHSTGWLLFISFPFVQRHKVVLVQKKESGSHLDYWVKFWAPQSRDMDIPEHAQQRPIMIIKYMEYFAYKEKLRGLELSILEERRPKVILY